MNGHFRVEVKGQIWPDSTLNILVRYSRFECWRISQKEKKKNFFSKVSLMMKALQLIDHLVYIPLIALIQLPKHYVPLCHLCVHCNHSNTYLTILAWFPYLFPSNGIFPHCQAFSQNSWNEWNLIITIRWCWHKRETNTCTLAHAYARFFEFPAIKFTHRALVDLMQGQKMLRLEH